MKGVGEVIAVNYNLFNIKPNCICGLNVSEQKRAYCLRKSFFLCVQVQKSALFEHKWAG